MIRRQFRKTIDRHAMLLPGDRVVLAVSGGPDSTALLALFRDLAPDLDLDLHVAHLNHGWRGRAAERDAEFVRRLAIRHRLPVTVGHVDPATWSAGGASSSREERARNLRYQFLRDTAAQVGARRVALGHTCDDQAETLLLRLLRGSGARGLAGIYPVVDDLFIRPLIEVRRRDVLAFLRQRRLRYRIDSSNRDLSLARNRLRRRLVPLMERSFNPRSVDALAHAAELLRDEDTYLSQAAESAYRVAALRRGEGVVLAARALHELPLALRRRVLRLALAAVRGDLRRITLGHVEQALRMLEAPGRRRMINLPGGLTISLGSGEIRVEPRDAAAAEPPGEPPACREALCPIPGAVALPGFDLKIRATLASRVPDPAALKSTGLARAYLDADLLSGPLLIRPRRPGDRFMPLGGPGTRKVKSFLIDRKVPVEERGRIPLVLSGERIAWVVGHQIDDRFKVTATTRRILVLEKE
jgi:tRNA(Ile)-lysidine synthase